MSPKTSGRIVGALILLAFVCYGSGSALAGGFAGITLMLLNSVVVAAIGFLVFGALRRPHPRTAAAYLGARAAEAGLLAAGAVLLASAQSGPADTAYQLGMLSLGLGSVPFCLALKRIGWLPGWLAIWGLVGYALLAAGAVAELMGYAVGLALSVPGGIFEVVFGLTLVFRGFSEPAQRRPRGVSASRRSALVAGLGLLVLASLAGLANFGVLERLVTDNAAQTTERLLSDQTAFQLAIAALAAVACLDVVVAWALWRFFDQLHHTVALAAAWSRAIYAVVFGIAISQLVAAAILLHGATAASTVSQDVFVQIGRFRDIWTFSLILFGVHLALVGWLAWRFGGVPRIVGALLAIAGAGYVADAAGPALWAGYTIKLAEVTFVGEVALMVWLLIHAAKREKPAASVEPAERAGTLAACE